ncbi:MAG: YdcF family protein [Candidatus Pacearchaeota archaeon]
MDIKELQRKEKERFEEYYAPMITLDKSTESLYRTDERPLKLDEVLAAQKIWDDFQLGHVLKPADVLLCLGSNDTLPAKNAVELVNNGWVKGPVIFCGKGGRFTEELKTTEARMLAEVAVNYGLQKEKIILEEESTHTGANFNNAIKIMNERGIEYNVVMTSHMPSAERRDWGHGKKALPPETELIITSPRVPMHRYHEQGFRGIPGQGFSPYRVVSSLMGDLQRAIVYVANGFMAPQEKPFPEEVIENWYFLTFERGIQKDHLKDKESDQIIDIKQYLELTCDGYIPKNK